jgi:hypothetical protein
LIRHLDDGVEDALKDFLEDDLLVEGLLLVELDEVLGDQGVTESVYGFHKDLEAVRSMMTQLLVVNVVEDKLEGLQEQMVLLFYLACAVPNKVHSLAQYDGRHR